MIGLKNSKKQGDVGLGMAIAYFASMGYTVSIPLTDSQDYDLIIDIEEKLYKVQVKTTTYKSKYGIFLVNLTVNGGNRTGKGKIKKFDNSKVDYVYIYTSEKESYFIPSNLITVKTEISLNNKMEKFKV